MSSQPLALLLSRIDPLVRSRASGRKRKLEVGHGKHNLELLRDRDASLPSLGQRWVIRCPIDPPKRLANLRAVRGFGRSVPAVRLGFHLAEDFPKSIQV